MSQFKIDCLHRQHNCFQRALITEIASFSQPTVAKDDAYSSCKQLLTGTNMA